MNRKEIDNLTDRELISLFQNECSYAFDCLYKRHYQSVFRYLRNLTRQKEKAEDLSQDVFLWVLLCFKENKFIGTDFFSQYLKSLSYYTFLKNIKNSKEILSDCNSFFDNMVDETANIQQMIIKEETTIQLKCLVAKLPQKKQTIIQLHLQENQVFSTIAENLNSAQTTIMSQYYSSIEELRLTAVNCNIRYAI